MNYREKAFKYLAPYCDVCCGWISLQVHHKDKNTNNNDITNLQILCEECHNKIHNVKKHKKINKKYQKGTRKNKRR